ncbi:MULTISPECIES: shikimate kinase [Sphingobacterium]|jgi:shikimate kinase|uniref:Shikimate kinase n=3 Tax=Sphingobacterium TaxID=28453 RepID=A0ABW5Z3P7_9SPHI|nr:MULTISPECIES: shikimate kinase [Sphingobacterium]MBB2952662.1 shikimate kinase [Sphingobacterium sp. JUb56]MCS3556049.1 shikimate kinase [Sphingobacterium sp. JUb21]MCW2261126.1 shikimate kinase [Sphingobacterium kitahiroshimense]NJI76233.1 AAA family ATPase [Sphingobacterium sp. B16(2022)]QQD11725.1 AAA family ATPase [Sphingobacterium sp. UDSM-2020]
MPKPIFLIGYMGSGKTTLAKKLASKLELPFIDTDDEIVKEIGMSITEYFQLHGEEKFRELERKQLLKTAQQNAIVSTGGGSPCFFDNMQWMNENGISVYLQMSPKSLFDRLSQSKPNKRPILIGKTEEELFNFITEKLTEREPFYQQAHLIIDHINTPIDDLIILLKKNQ